MIEELGFSDLRFFWLAPISGMIFEMWTSTVGCLEISEDFPQAPRFQLARKESPYKLSGATPIHAHLSLLPTVKYLPPHPDFSLLDFLSTSGYISWSVLGNFLNSSLCSIPAKKLES